MNALAALLFGWRRCSRGSAAIHTGRFALRRAEAARVPFAPEAA
ncbi:hypothetical protein [Solimonas soli]|nr:hypothetical protein [Solimonas soli]